MLTAVAAGLEYQWVDCENNNMPIIGAVAQSFEPAENGNYAVIITNGNCSETSECTTVTVTGIEDKASHDAIAVFPNPFNDMLTVRTGSQAGTVRVELFNTDGRLVSDETPAGQDLITVQCAQLSPGSYTLRLTTQGASITSRLVK